MLIFSVKGSVLFAKIQDLCSTRGRCRNDLQCSKALDSLPRKIRVWSFLTLRQMTPKPLNFAKKIKKTKEDNRFNVYFLVDNNPNIEEQLEWFDLGMNEFGTRDTNATLITRRITNILAKYFGSMKEVVPQEGIHHRS